MLGFLINLQAGAPRVVSSVSVTCPTCASRPKALMMVTRTPALSYCELTPRIMTAQEKDIVLLNAWMWNRLGGGMSRLQIFLLFFSQENGDPRGSQKGGGSILLLIKAQRCMSQTAARLYTAPGEEPSICTTLFHINHRIGSLPVFAVSHVFLKTDCRPP